MKTHVRISVLAAAFFLLSSNFLPDSGEKTKRLSTREIEIQLSFPHLGRRFQGCCDSTLFVKVCFINHTDTVASFYEDWNTWGYFNITFQIRTDKGLDTLVKRDRIWTRNFPSYVSLFPGDSMLLSYNLTKDHCPCYSSGLGKIDESPFRGTLPRPGHGLKGIKAIYQLDSMSHANQERFPQDSIKYKYAPLPSIKGRRGDRRRQAIIIDSLKTAVETKRTFPLVKLESAEYKF